MKKELIPVYDFAKRKEISHTKAYQLINDNTIVAEKIGNNLFIDWNKYKDFVIELSKAGRRKVV